MGVTAQLVDDHRVIEKAIRGLRAAAGKARKGQPVDPLVFVEALDFMRTFADACHHGKEESNLFPALEAHGLSPEMGPVAVMLGEHEHGRAYVKGMAEALKQYQAGDKSAIDDLASNAEGYAVLLTDHIAKENNVLFPMAEKMLTPEEQSRLAEAFHKVEVERIGEGRHQEYERLAEKIEQEAA